MKEPFPYPVFFECHQALSEHKKKVEIYFRVRRRSGGGECGPLTTVAENVYSITFRYQKDQQEVLRRSRHVLELADGHAVTVQVSLEPPSTSNNTNLTTPAENPQFSPASAAPSSGEEGELQLDDHFSNCMKESQTTEKPLDKDLTPVCGSQLQPEEGKPLDLSPAQPDAVGEVSDLIMKEDQLVEGYSGQYQDSASESFFDAEDMPSLREGNTVAASYWLTDGLQVVVCEGDITSLEADALVNAANEDLDHCEGVAAALSRAGGPDVQCESYGLVKYIGKIPTGDVVVTTGGNLKCKKLLHAVVPVHREAVGRERILLERTVLQVLNLAERMKTFRSIGMPCMGSGMRSVPVTVCSEAMATAVKEFASQDGRSLRRIILIDSREKVVRAMVEACDRILQGISNRNNIQSDVESQGEAVVQEAECGATAGAAGGRVCVEIVQGTIETQEVDVLASPMFGSDPLSTRIGNILNELVGSQMTSMFRKAGGEDSLPGDSVLLEGLSGLPSTAILFLNLLPWNDDECSTAAEVLRLGINNILSSCEARGFGSVALPLLGAGVALRFPHSVVAEIILEQVHEYEQSRASSTPLVVRIVIHPSDEEAFRSVQEVFKESEEVPKETQQEVQDQGSTTKRIILLGKTGSGKSHLANTIFGEDLFTAHHSPNSGTRECQAETKSVNGRSLTLIDTPGFFDTEKSEVDMKPEIMSCITECAPGPHAFLIVLRVGKFSKHEQEVITKICEYFSEDALNYAVIVFTHGDQLPKKMKIEEFVSQNQKLSDLVTRCGGRCHVFDSRHWKNNQPNNYRSNCFQLEALLCTLDEMMVDKRGRYYTNVVLQDVEKQIQKKEEQIKVSSGTLSPVEIREKAKISVSNDFLIQLAGTTTGVLLGAFFGVVAMVQTVIKEMRNPSQTIKLVKKIPAIVGAPAALIGGEMTLAAGVIAGVAAAATGGVMGGVIGHDVAKEAETPKQAVQKAFQAVMKKGKEKLQ